MSFEEVYGLKFYSKKYTSITFHCSWIVNRAFGVSELHLKVLRDAFG